MKRLNAMVLAGISLLAGMSFAPQAQGAWNGLGVSGGTSGSDICTAANWENNVIDGDFSTITATNEPVVLTMSGNLERMDSNALTTNLTFVAGTNVISVSAPSLEPGLLISGTGINNTMVTAVDAENGTVSLTQPTSANASGSYSFIRASFNFNFGLRTTKAVGVSVTIESDTPGVARTLSARPRIIMSQPTTVRNTLVFSKDITVVFPVGEGILTRDGGAYNGGTLNPLLTLNGSMDLSGPGFASNGGDLTLNGVVSGTGKYLHMMYMDRKTLTLTCPGNTFSGRVMLSANGGTPNEVLRFNSIANSGQPSALGAGSLIALGLPGSRGTNYFEFLGDENNASDKELQLKQAFTVTGTEGYGNAYNNILSSGDGVLTLTGLLSQDMPVSITASRYLCFGGTGDGVFSGSASLSNRVNGTAVGSVAVHKTGTGTWRFAGTNMNYGGDTHIMAGNLILDYGAYDQLVSNTNAVVMRGGALTFRGKPEGVTTDAVGSVKINDNKVYNYFCNKLVLDANGGDGFNLVVTNLSVLTSDTPLLYTLLDLSSSTDNILTLMNLQSPITTAQRGELMFGPYNTQARFILKTADGYCFPTTNSLGQVVPPSLTSLPTSGFNVNTRYLLATPGTTTLAGTGMNIMSLTVDSNAGDVTLDAGANPISPSGAAKGGGLLCRGTNSVAITGSSAWQCRMFSFFNFLDPERAALQFDLKIGSASEASYTTWGGCGLTAYSGLGLGFNGSFTLCGGLFRMTTEQTLAVNSLVLTDGGVFELGADLNGATPGDFTLACGAGSNQVLLYGDAGFSAAGGNRVVNLGGASAKLTWGASGFLSHQEGVDYGNTLKLSSPRADAMVDFQNPLDLNGDSKYVRRRTVEVADGSAAIDALLSGAISGNSTLVKTGAGTLKVTAAQSYEALRVNAGTFLAADGCFSAAHAVSVNLKAGATLAGLSGGNNVFGALTLTGNATLDVGDGSSGMVFADSSAIDWAGGKLTIKGRLQPGKVRFGTDAGGLSATQLGSIVMDGASKRIDGNGYLVRVPLGTLILVQ